MAIPVNQIIELMTQTNVPAGNRGKLLSIALARAIGYSLQIPTSKVESPLTYYIAQEKTIADQAVSEVNEQMALDVEKTCQLIQAFWLFRYRVVYDAGNAAVRNFMDGLVKVGSREFPGYVSEFMIDLPDDWIMDRVAAMIRDGFGQTPSTESRKA